MTARASEVPRTSKWFLKVAATARAGKVHKKEAQINVSSTIELVDSTSKGEGTVGGAGVTDKASEAECSWDGTVNYQPEPFHSSNEGGHEAELSSDESELEVLELEGKELLQSLGQCITKERELLTPPTPFKRLRIGMSASECEKAEKNRHLGYNDLSARMRQRHEQRACEKETRDAVQCQR